MSTLSKELKGVIKWTTMSNDGRILICDLDSMLHIVANVQWKADNRDNPEQVKEHVRRFYSTIRKSAGCQYSISFYQKLGHTNFRNAIWSRYKESRKSSEAVALWKPTIIEAFSELGAIGLQYVESDDMVAALAPHIGADRIVITSSDKDMQQVAGHHYNPFKPGPADAEWRRFYINRYYANRFLWEQVLSGDGGDMPIDSDGAGIEGVGPKTAEKMVDNDMTFMEIIAKAYTAKYGVEKGMARAQLTYQMVRLLNGTDHDVYAGKEANEEIAGIKKVYKEYISEVSNDAAALFGVKPTKGSDLFK